MSKRRRPIDWGELVRRRWVVLAGLGVAALLLLLVWGKPRAFPLAEQFEPGAEPVDAGEWEETMQPFPEIRSPAEYKSTGDIAEPAPVGEPRQARLWNQAIPSGAIVHHRREREDAALDSIRDSWIEPRPVVDINPESQAWNGPVAPVGRLLRVELVNAIDTSGRGNPILGLVTHDFYWGGRLLIPAGTEVHGRTTGEVARESMLTARDWQLVFPQEGGAVPSGWVLPLRAEALERGDPTGEGSTFSLTDMRMGIPGYRMRADEVLDFQLFAAQFMGGALSTLQSRRVNALSGTSVVEETATNAALAGMVEVLGNYSRELMAEIERVGFYLRVRAGTQFYLLVRDPIDLNRGHPAEASPEPSLLRRGSREPESLAELEELLGQQWEELWEKGIQRVRDAR